MKLKDLYPYIDENKCLWVLTDDGYPLDMYDGRNSIAHKWDNYDIVRMYGEDNKLVVEIDYSKIY